MLPSNYSCTGTGQSTLDISAGTSTADNMPSSIAVLFLTAGSPFTDGRKAAISQHQSSIPFACANLTIASPKHARLYATPTADRAKQSYSQPWPNLQTQ